MKRYFKRVVRSASILLNVITGGYEEQTFAARQWHRSKQGKVNLSWHLDLIFGKDHCSRAWVDWQLSQPVRKDGEVY